MHSLPQKRARPEPYKSSCPNRLQTPRARHDVRREKKTAPVVILNHLADNLTTAVGEAHTSLGNVLSALRTTIGISADRCRG